MEKYSKSVIAAYITGGDLDYSFDELENDIIFMMKVIDFIGDKNFYYLCSDEIKKDFSFIKFMIRKFKNNIDFICDIADYYLENEKDSYNRLEIAILMTKYTFKKNKENYYIYKTIQDSRFVSEKVRTKLYSKKEVEEGFIVILDKFAGREIILDCFAQKFLNGIFNDYDINLEKYLHMNFKNKSDINKMGINRFMLGFISQYDTALSAYFQTNISLLGDFAKDIEFILSRWEKYNEMVEEDKCYFMIKRVNDYMDNTYISCHFSSTDLLYYVGRELNILEKILKFDHVTYDYAEEILKQMDEFILNNESDITFTDKVCYRNVKNIMTSILSSKSIEELDDYIKGKKEGKIIEFKKT